MFCQVQNSFEWLPNIYMKGSEELPKYQIWAPEGSQILERLLGPIKIFEGLSNIWNGLKGSQGLPIWRAPKNIWMALTGSQNIWRAPKIFEVIKIWRAPKIYEGFENFGASELLFREPFKYFEIFKYFGSLGSPSEPFKLGAHESPSEPFKYLRASQIFW